MAKYREEYFEADRVYSLLGKNVRELRKRCRLTQIELAEKIECDQKQISRIELGLAHPSLVVCLKLANAFDVSVDTLLDGIVESNAVRLLLNDSSEQLLAQELLQVVKKFIE